MAAIRFAPEEKSWIQAYADFIESSFSEVVRQTALARAENAADKATYEQAIRGEYDNPLLNGRGHAADLECPMNFRFEWSKSAAK